MKKYLSYNKKNYNILKLSFLKDLQIIASGLNFNQTDITFYSKYWTRSVTFTAEKSGQYLVCAYSEDSTNLTSDLGCYQMVVNVPPPSITLSSLSPIGLVYFNNSFTLNFTVKFNAIVKRSTVPAYIDLLDADNNYTVITSLNSTLKRYVSISNNTMVFTFGAVFIPFKNYSISIDAGNEKNRITRKDENV
jgi:hypothetical protein